MKKSDKAVRGSDTGRPIMVLLDHLGQRWALRIIWELRDDRITFRQLQERCDQVSPTMLNRRLKELRGLNLIDHDTGGYGLTQYGEELGERLIELSDWSKKWARSL